MAASSLSIAAAVSVSSPVSSAAASSLDHFSVVTNLTFPIKISIPTKLSNFKSHSHLSFSPSSRVSRPRFRAFSGDFDGLGDNGSEEIVEEEYVPPEEENEEEVNEERVASQPAEARRLYVGNLPFSMTSSQLAEIFSEAGRVVSMEVVYDKVTDRSRGFAFATMSSVEEAKEAIRLFDGSQVGGRNVKVNFPEVPRGGEREVMRPEIRSSNQGFVDTPHKIYAGNLSWNVTSQGLREMFQDQPGFLSAKVIYDRNSGRSRGFGFVTFASAEEVQAALNALNEVELEGRPLRLNLAEQRPPVSPSKFGSYSATAADNSEVFSGISS